MLDYAANNQILIWRNLGVACLLSIGCGLPSAIAQSASTPTQVSLNAALEMALKENPQLGVARSALEAETARIKQSEAAYHPQVTLDVRREETTLNVSQPSSALPSLDFSSTPLGSQLGSVPISYPKKDMTGVSRVTATLNMEYVLYDFGRRSNVLLANTENAGSARENLAKTTNETLLNVVNTYFNVLRSQELVVVDRESRGRQIERLRIAETLHSAGRGSAADVARAKADLARADLKVVQSENDVRLAQLALRRAIGLPPESSVLTPLAGSRLSLPGDIEAALKKSLSGESNETRNTDSSPAGWPVHASVELEPLRLAAADQLGITLTGMGRATSRNRTRSSGGSESGNLDHAVFALADTDYPRLALATELKLEPASLQPPEVSEDNLKLRPEISSQERVIAGRIAVVEKEKAELFPTFSLIGNYNVMKYEGSAISPNYAYGVQLRWNLYDGFQRSGRIDEARARLLQEKSRLRDLQLAVVSDMRDSYQRYTEARERLSTSERVLQSSELDLKLAQQGYKEGIRTIYDLSTADTNYASARAQRVVAEYDLQTAIAKVFWAMGTIQQIRKD